MKILKRKGLEGAAYFKNNNLMVSKRDFDAVKKALRFDKIPMTPPKIVVEEVALDEGNYRVTYSTKGKLFSKKIRAKSEDEAEDIFVKQFKDKKIPIDADDIRSVVKEGETQ